MARRWFLAVRAPAAGTPKSSAGIGSGHTDAGQRFERFFATRAAGPRTGNR